MFYFQGCQDYSMGVREKTTLFKKACGKKLDIHMQERKLGHLTSDIKIGLKWVSDPNVKAETIKLLEEITGGKL